MAECVRLADHEIASLVSLICADLHFLLITPGAAVELLLGAWSRGSCLVGNVLTQKVSMGAHTADPSLLTS